MMSRHRMQQERAALEKLQKNALIMGSAFLDASQLLLLKDRLVTLINEKEDSLRFYYLGNNYRTKVEHFGCKSSYEAEGTLMI